MILGLGEARRLDFSRLAEWWENSGRGRQRRWAWSHLSMLWVISSPADLICLATGPRSTPSAHSLFRDLECEPLDIAVAVHELGVIDAEYPAVFEQDHTRVRAVPDVARRDIDVAQMLPAGAAVRRRGDRAPVGPGSIDLPVTQQDCAGGKHQEAGTVARDSRPDGLAPSAAFVL